MMRKEVSGRGDWIRTSDIPLPKRTLYQAEPRPDQRHCTRSATLWAGLWFARHNRELSTW